MTHSTHPFTCDACGLRFPPEDGGRCVACDRLLCGEHLWGLVGTWRRLLARAPLCRECAAHGGGGTIGPPTASPPDPPGAP